ncbi:hypothetical protein AAFF_G00431980 [Aldrovandia affinis]|uniref:Integrase catalytic domain-containing protein n=1 Tax=Aldrovandia affinis TaxID=143900 RepID=A0AAD7R2Y7_9TELE|nr:hypothetical protein AAFF_G00431980 [Aldrovandia affinis]
MGNGITERFNRTLGGMIRALPPKSKSRWPQMLQMLTFCYNSTVHETTGFAPFYLMFGRVPRLPVDVMFHHVLEDANVVSHHEFVHHLKRDLSEAAQIAQKNAIGEQNRHAKIYNRKVRGMPLAVGDRVLLANRGERGKRKVADRWDSTPFDVVSVRSTINVYRIKDVHRNMLLPVDFLTFPDQDGDGDLTSLGESRSNASCVSVPGPLLHWIIKRTLKCAPWIGSCSHQSKQKQRVRAPRRKMLSGRPYLWIPQRKTNQMSCWTVSLMILYLTTS